MKIVNIVPGFGGSFYCGNCMRDSVLTNALKSDGHDAITLPIYLPMSLDDKEKCSGTPIFYGAVNIYLKQKFKFLRNMPSWLERFFNSAPILRYAAKKAGSTRADGLEEMTISMLKGSEGFQKDELQHLIDFLKNHEKPDIVHLSNALLLGLAKKIKEELQIPVVCSLQDEDVWIDAMNEEYQKKLWNLMGEKAKDVDAFIGVSDFFANVMKKNMNISDDKVFVIPISINPEKYKSFVPSFDPPVIGFLSRMYEEHGFGLLIDAFIELKQRKEFKKVKLRITGGKTADDNAYFKKQIKKLKKNNLYSDLEYVEDFQTENLDKFFDGLSFLTVPVLKGEAFGAYQLESLASGIPLIQPTLGAFPEIIEKTGGGVTYIPNDSETLAEKWAEMILKPKLLKEMGEKGKTVVLEQFNNKVLTEKMINIYKKLVFGEEGRKYQN